MFDRCQIDLWFSINDSLFVMCVPIIYLLLLNYAEASIMPVTRDTGSALDSVIEFLRGSVQISYNAFRPKPREIEEKTVWQTLTEYFGFAALRTEKAVAEPMIISNVYVILTLILAVFFYILFAKKYFSTQKCGPSFAPFMSEAGDEFEISESEHGTDDDDCRCNCKIWEN